MFRRANASMKARNGQYAVETQASNNELRMSGGDAVCHLVVHEDSIDSIDDVFVYLSQNGGVPLERNFALFRPGFELNYEPFCDDFGPMNALQISRFVVLLDAEIKKQGRSKKCIVYSAEGGPRALTNASFLLGCYMILSLGKNPGEVWKTFCALDGLFEGYRDASPSEANFRLELIDCWQGLARAQQKGWITFPSPHDPTMWGKIDMDEYEHYDNPFNADLNEVIPGQAIIFRGPKDLGGRDFRNNVIKDWAVYRDFSPEYLIDILRDKGVTTILRLNQPQYDSAAFTEQGFRFIDLPCEETSMSRTPAPSTVSYFFKVMDEAVGAVAIHGRSSFGRAGTLVGLQLMRGHGFSAREAIAWVRIMRPGCIVGSQQQYLVGVEASIGRHLAAIPASPIPLSSPPSAPSAACADTQLQAGCAGPMRKARSDRPDTTHVAYTSHRRHSQPALLVAMLPQSSDVIPPVAAAFDPVAARAAMRTQAVASSLRDVRGVSVGNAASVAAARAFAATFTGRQSQS